MNYFDWIKYEIRGYKRARFEEKTGSSSVRYIDKYANKGTWDCKKINEEIYRAISEGTPYFVGRIGGNEMNAIAYYYRNMYFPFRTDARKENIHDLCVGAGFFPDDIDSGRRFVELMTDSATQLDLVGIWSRYMEEWFLHEYAKDTAMTWLHNLEPWNLENESKDEIRWTYALEGKKVLVIHPFEDTIRNQYLKREHLFENLDSRLLPEFELLTLKAVQSMGGVSDEYQNWFEAYEDMLEKIKKVDFDVAILGCGAYGFPLGAEIKKLGKIAIHLGGTTQLLFGIRGKRWDSYGGVYESMVNEYWTRPSDTEITPAMKKVEGGCYC